MSLTVSIFLLSVFLCASKWPLISKSIIYVISAMANKCQNGYMTRLLVMPPIQVQFSAAKEWVELQIECAVFIPNVLL